MKKNRVGTLVAVAMLAAFLLAGCNAGSVGSGPVKMARFKMTTRAVVVDIPKSAKVLDVWMPYPQTKANQTITEVSVDSPYPVEVNYEKEYGNAILHTRVENPKKDFELAINFEVARTENRALDEARRVRGVRDRGDFKNFMRYDRVGELTPLLKGQAERITRGKKGNVEKAKAIYDHIAKNYIYDFEKRSLPKLRGNLAEFCKTKKGRCTELSTLFGTLARAVGIPVKYTSGYTMRNHESGEIGGHCCWVEFYAPGYGWVPADSATAKKFPDDVDYYFGNTDEWRVELVTGRDLVLEPAQKGPRINAWIDPYAEIDGRVFVVGKRISWKKL